ncbi:DNA methyltransferase [Lichenifustis flavocetrariae]|uniref:Methyltransferase n=1 Tax=Lichenifustis flavocetrariae TaxID=2949735 RepID=A0AA42CRB2_9HYPH|nr:DNA methyltransferase [Lichenifustis flavocetrariae]MCW6512302.1 DNA methyltransferase [Lichenifustis flavocetrariae]
MEFLNSIIQGDCRQVLQTFPSLSVDLVVTDPPYLVNYRDRSGRTVKNDGGETGILSAFSDMYRVLKPNSICVSFYGWNRADEFFKAWREAGFRPVAHIVWKKDYTSKAAFVQYRHEQAYVLAKGNPQLPAKPIEDVQPWAYSGNRAHPTEKAVSILQPIIRSFSRPGAIVLDPFSGSGSTAVAAALCGRSYVGVELEADYCAHARTRLAGAAKYAVRKPT